ncbi:Fc receptor-like protein 3 [Lithobates pipiens]
MGKSGGAIRSVVTFTPNWGNVLQGDSVDITCDVPSTVPEEPRTYHWYKDNQPIPEDHQILHITSSSEEDSGDYQCQAGASDISDPVTLNVTNCDLILQRPLSTVYEGDPLTMRCQQIKDFRGFQPRLYKDNEEIQSQSPGSRLRIYKRSAFRSVFSDFPHPCQRHPYLYHRWDCLRRLPLCRIELSSPPEIKVTPSKVIEAGEMTVKCDARLIPLRGCRRRGNEGYPELRFKFYRDGQAVRENNISDTYRVQSAQLKDSGKYFCEVTALDYTERHMSDGLYIGINAAIKPVVTFTPKWWDVLEGDEVTLTCDVPSTVPEEPRTYQWYKDNQPIPGDQQSLHTISARINDSGKYQCQTIGGHNSDAVTLNVTNSSLILQKPPSAIYEGDPLTLRCHHIKEYSSFQTRFYKNNEEIKSQFPDSELRIHKVDLNTTGHYKCTKQIEFPGSSDYHETSDEFSVSVKELFSPPKITVTPSRLMEGNYMMVICDTRPDLLRGGTELHFAFYRDGRTVQGYGVSDTYRVPSSQLKDSGKYTCEVRTRSDTVRKMSDGIYIQIYGAIKPVVIFNPIWGNVLVGDSVTVTCDVPSTVPKDLWTYHWYKDKHKIPGDQQTLQITSDLVDSGEYQCQIGNSDISDNVTLLVMNSHVILQSPPSAIYEGDNLTLRCHHIKEYHSSLPIFFKNNEEIKSQVLNFELHIQKVDLNTTGQYTCTKWIQKTGLSASAHTGEFFVSVKELFSPPKIKVTPSRVIEGREMTVRCDTRLDPHRDGTELHFAFYRDGRTVQEFNVSDTYRVWSPQLEDSGNYTCEVKTVSGTVRKMSDVFHIEMFDYTVQNIIRLVISGFVLAAALCFIYFHNKW